MFSLLAAKDGSLWIGTGTNLSHLKDGDLISYNNAAGRINSILEDRGGTIWIARSRIREATGPLCRVVDPNLECLGSGDGIKPPYAEPLTEDSEGNLWIGSSTVLTRWGNGSVENYSPPGLGTAEGLSGVQALAAFPDGNLWIGMGRTGNGLGLQRMADGVLKPFITPEIDTSTLEVNALFRDSKNALWIGTQGQGIYRIHDGRVDRFNRAGGLTSDAVENFYEDREGNVWVATAEGLDCFRDIRVVSFSTNEGMIANEINSVAATRDGRIWASNHGALQFLVDGKVFSIGEKEGLPGKSVTALLEDHAGRLWVGVDNGLAVYEAGKFRSVKRPDGTPVGVVTMMTEDRDNNIWAETLGNPAKLIRIQDFVVLEEIPAPTIPRVFSLTADRTDGIWLGLFGGDLGRYRQGQLEVFPFPHGENGRIRQVSAMPDGSMLGASASGLIGWREGRAQTMTMANGLPCDNLFGLISDNHDRLWLYAECGLAVIDKSQIQAWWGDPATRVNVKLLDVFDGARPAPPPFHPVTARGTDGRLWFANEKVLQVVDPENLEGNPVPPPVFIEALVSDRVNFPLNQEVQIPPRPRDLEIEYTALSFVAPQKVRFRYMLEGRDTEWQEAGTRRQAFYSDLSPGRYRFRVIACNNDGVWNDTGAVLQFVIAPAFYQTNWFLLAWLGFVGCLAWMGYRWRIYSVKHRLRLQFEERLAERTRLAQELHDTLLQGVFSASMQLDAANDQLNEDSPIKPRLNRVKQLMQLVLTEGRNTIRGLHSGESETSLSLESAFSEIRHDLDAAEETDFQVIVKGEPQPIHLIVRDELYRLGREALVNAFRHAQAHRIEVEIDYESLNFRLCIRDDGVGIDPKILRDGRAGHLGLPGMREGSDRIGAKLNIGNRTKGGTVVELSIPKHIAFKDGASGGLLKALRNSFRRKTKIRHSSGTWNNEK